MEKIPKTIRQLLDDVKKDTTHKKEDLISFLWDVICLYEDYDGLSECLIYIVNELKKQTNTGYKEYLPVVDLFSRLCKDKESFLLKEQEELNNIEELFILNQKNYLQNNDDIDEIKNIGECAYYLNEPVMHIVAEMLLNQLKGNSQFKDGIGVQILKQQNIGFLIEMLAEKGNTFLVIADNADKINYDVFANMLFRLGQKIILMIQCVSAEENVEYYLNLTEQYEDLTVIPYTESVLWKLVHVCCEKYADNHMVCLIGNGHVLDLLSMQAERGCEVERLTSMVSPALEEKLTYGWAGDYLSYISYIYQFDAHKEIDADIEYKFSIIIPAKDSADTLRYTLQTCLSQRWNGKYEIIVSDNSSEGNTAIHELCEELNDKRLHYYKTPRMLAIGRNFEYAFLKSRGEFLISIGSDDGLLPWTLEVLNEVLENNNDEIITWTRGQYQWPDFGKGMSDYLEFPCSTEKGKYEIYYIDGVVYLDSVLKQTMCMYALPLLYISSGFRRRYMKTLLNKTGRLWDGPCQDIFMGIINSVINEKICRINYPLSIAGMASHSTGQKYTRLLDSIDKVNQRRINGDLGETSYIGGWASSVVERAVPRITSDIGLCFNCFIRIVAKKILPSEFAVKYFNLRKWFEDLYELMDKKEYIFERQVREMHYAAFCNGPEFMKWFEDTLFKLAMQTDEYQESSYTKTETKNYRSGITDDGTFFLDASKCGVTNIYEAVMLVEQISQY